MAERRAALRLSREQHTLGLDLGAADHVTPATASRAFRSTTRADESLRAAASFTDDLDDMPAEVVDDHFYDDVLEDV